MELIGNYTAAHETMLNNQNSQLVSDDKKVHIKLPPKYMGNIGNGVKHYLTSLMSKQERLGDGYPIAFANIKILQQMGKIISDQPCIHFDVNADFIFFKPVIGCKLEGKVNKLGRRHLGCLVHGCFNAWVPHTPVTENLSPDKVTGALIQFTVLSISTNRNIVSIKGKFEKFLSEELKTANENEKGAKQGKKLGRPKASVKDADSQENIADDSSQAAGNDSIISQDASVGEGDISMSKKSKKKIKKEKKRRSEIENGDGDISTVSLGEPMFNSTQIATTPGVKSSGKINKHKLKRKQITGTDDLDDSVGDIMNISDVSGCVNGLADISEITADSPEPRNVSSKDKKNKKRKQSEDSFTKIKDHDAADHSVLSEPSPAKKHKKHKKHKAHKSEKSDMDDSLNDFVVSSSGSKKSKKEKH